MTKIMRDASYLTISVDDGHPTDARAAELLDKYGLKATFYIPARNPERELMLQSQICNLAQHFELGSHTFSHRPLKDLPDPDARREITEGKKWLEDLTGREVVSFCYPRGKFTLRTVQLVREAGFLGARTCKFNLSGFPANPFLWGVSTHAYSHSAVTQFRHALLEGNIRGLANFISLHKGARDWVNHFGRAVDFVERHGGVAHLYFHSWEIDEQEQWKKMENLLAGIAKRKGLTRVTNGELFAQWYAKA